MSAKTKWRIELFGEPRVSVGGQWITRFRTRRAALLLARLALENTPVRRDVLVEWLWPDSPFEVGRNRLSVTLSALRRALETPVTRSKLFWGNHDLVGLNLDEVQCDVLEFEDLFRRAQTETERARRLPLLREALALWRAPLWSGEEFDWLRDKSKRLNDLLCQTALELNEFDAEAGREELQRAHQVNPTREDVAAALLRSLAAVGKSEEASRVWRKFEKRLRMEHNRVPSSETRVLARRLFEAQEVPSTPTQTERLPRISTRFFGRQSEIELLLEWLSPGSQVHLITLFGGSGHGKTRLALEAAHRKADSFDATHFVSLAGQNDSRRLLETIGDSLRAPRASSTNALERIAKALGQRRVLLILDNFEHLASAAPDVERLLKRLPSLVCLVTSRCLLELEIEGEQELTLAPLPLPSQPDDTVEAAPDALVLEEWARNPAMRLFTDRARAVSPAFRLHVGNARAVARLCRALEGVPLALELAAARSLALSPAQIEEYLRTHLNILEQEVKTPSEERHRSLRAALDWSYELLSPSARRLFRRLSVFRGSWTLERAYAVCAVSPRDDIALIVRAHEELRRYSLIEGEDEGKGLRFRFLETVRLYSSERTTSADKRETQRSLEKRHAREFARFAQNAVRASRGQKFNEWTQRLERDLPDLRAALNWALENDGALALRLAASLWWFWFSTSRLDEGRDLLAKALAASQHLPAAELTGEEEAPEHINWRAEALGGAGFLAWRQGDLAKAIELSQQARDLCREEGDTRALTYALIVLQLAALVRCDFETVQSLGQECLQLARAAGDQQAEAFALHLLGGEAEARGDAPAAWSLQEQSVALFDELHSLEGKGWALFNWGSAARRLGDYERAVSLCSQGRQVFESIGSREGMAYCDVYAGLTFCDAGDRFRAQTILTAGMKELLALQALWGVTIALEGFAKTYFDGSEPSAVVATRAWGAAQHVRSLVNAPIPPVDRASFAKFEEGLKEALPSPSFEAAWQTGRSLSLEQIVRALPGM